ncbi:MAG: hypothetical protein U0518_01005 [Candidatus Gracilibacteria bacterium]
MFGNIETGTGKICTNSGAIVGFTHDGTPQCGKVIRNMGTASGIAGIIPAGISTPNVVMQAMGIPNSRIAGFFGNILNHSCDPNYALVGFTYTGALICKNIDDLIGFKAGELNISSDNNQVISGSGITISWISQNTKNCKLQNQPVSPNGTQYFIVSEKTEFKIQCFDEKNISIEKQITVDIITVPTPNITFQIKDGTDTRYVGSTIDLSWNVSDADTCFASNVGNRQMASENSWYGAKGFSGTTTVSVYENDIYYLKCKKTTSGIEKESQKYIALNTLNPILSFTSDINDSIEIYKTLTLSWNSNEYIPSEIVQSGMNTANQVETRNVLPCTISGPGISGNKNEFGHNITGKKVSGSGSILVQATVANDLGYNISCFLSNGSSVQRSVGPIKVTPAPRNTRIDYFYDANGYQRPYTQDGMNRIYASGDEVHLNWGAYYHDGCEILGKTNISYDNSYKFTIGPNDTSRTYTLRCHDAGTKKFVEKELSIFIPSPTIATNPTPEIEYLWATYDNTRVEALSSFEKTTNPYINISWSAKNIEHCEASWDPVYGSKNIQAGTYKTMTYTLQDKLSNSQNSKKYSITCYGNSGTSIQKSIDLNWYDQTIPKITLIGPTSITKNNTGTVLWSTQNVTNCVGLGDESTWIGDKSLSGSFVTSKLSQTTSYILRCKKGDGSIIEESIKIEVVGSSISPGGTPAIKTFWATFDNESYYHFNDPTKKISYKNPGFITLSYQAENIESCSTSWNPINGAKQTNAENGIISSQTQAYTLGDGAKEYSISCQTKNGIITENLTIYLEPSSYLTFVGTYIDSNNQYSHVEILSGQTVALNWNTTSVDLCAASEDWSGTKESSGSYTTPVLTSNKSYTLTCSGKDGIQRIETVTVSVITSKKPTILLGIKNGEAYKRAGDSVTISWNVSNADRCERSGWWATGGNLGSNDSWMQTEGFIGDISIRSPFATTYGLTCWKGNEYTTEYISITIKPHVSVGLTATYFTGFDGIPKTQINWNAEDISGMSWDTKSEVICHGQDGDNSGNWNSLQKASGSYIIPKLLTTETVYTMYCSIDNQTTSNSSYFQGVSKSITVDPQSIPKASLSINISNASSNMKNGEYWVYNNNGIVNWTAKNVSNCKIYNISNNTMVEKVDNTSDNNHENVGQFVIPTTQGISDYYLICRDLVGNTFDDGTKHIIVDTEVPTIKSYSVCPEHQHGSNGVCSYPLFCFKSSNAFDIFDIFASDGKKRRIYWNGCGHSEYSAGYSNNELVGIVGEKIPCPENIRALSNELCNFDSLH